MKITSEKLPIIYGKTLVVQWVKMKNSGLWLLNNILLATAQKVTAKSLHQLKKPQLQKR